MDEQLQYKIIYELVSNKKVPKNKLLEKFDIGKYKLDNIIWNMNLQLKESNSEISFINNNYELFIGDDFKFQEYYQFLLRLNYDDNHNERFIHLIDKLINNEYVKIEDLAEELFITTRQVSNDLKSVYDIMAKYGISVKSIPHHGITAIGSEFNKRLCLAEMFEKKYDFQKKENDILCIIKETLKEELESKNYEIEDFVFQNLVIHLYTAVLRIKSGYDIERFELDDENFIENEIASDVLNYLENQLKIKFSKNEKNYIVAHLKGKRKYLPSNVISSEVNEVVNKFLDYIDKESSTNFRFDFDLCMMLNLHFAPLINRIKYGIPAKNPLLNTIKSDYIYEFELARYGSKVFYEKYNCTLSEDEIAYLALDIRLSLEKRYNKTKRNVLLVCSTGRGSAELLRLKINREFKDYIDCLETCSSNEFKNKNLDSYDYIFTTVPLAIETRIPVFLMSLQLEEDDMSYIRNNFLKETKQQEFEEIFKKELFIPLLDSSSKEDTIIQMSNYISKYYRIPENFYQSVLEREKLSETSFFNNVAFPHPNGLITETTIICIAILKNAITWGKNGKVRVVVLSSFSKNGKDKHKTPVKMFSIINDSAFISQLIRNPDYDNFENLVCKNFDK